MTNNENTPKKPKAKNGRYKVVSKASEVLNQFYKDNHYERVTDMCEEIGEFAGVTPSTINQMRLKDLLPSYIVAMKVAEFIGVEPTDIWEITELEDYVERPKCVVEGCERVGATKGLCLKHTYLLRDLKEGRNIEDHMFREYMPKEEE